MDCDFGLCAARNIHGRTEAEIRKLHANWEPTPPHYNRLDLRGFLQDKEIEQVDMEDVQVLPTPSTSSRSKSKFANDSDDDEVRFIDRRDSRRRQDGHSSMTSSKEKPSPWQDCVWLS